MSRVILKEKVEAKLKWLMSSTSALALVLTGLLPVILTNSAEAAQLSQRKITISSSVLSATSVSYAVSFRTTQTTVIRGLVVEICQNSPIVGIACTTTNGVTATPTTGTVTFTNAGSSGDATFEVHANSTATGRYIVTDSDGATGGDGITPVTSADFTFSFTATNPSGTSGTAGAVGSFYARILTYSTAADASAYVSATPGNNILDSGGIALSTVRQLTVNARVQEELEFCVGTIDNTVTNAATFQTYNGSNACSGTAFSSSTPTVDLGVVSSTSVSLSPVTSNGGNSREGVFDVRTNAVNGATVTYFAQQDSSSGRLKVTGQTCSGNSGAFDTTSGLTDQCFGSNATQSDFTVTAAGQQEEFGMTGLPVYVLATTSNLTRDTNYDGAGTAAGGLAWQQNGTTTTLATSSTVLDYEAVVLRFAARSAATTPTGQYTVVSTYVATGLF